MDLVDIILDERMTDLIIDGSIVAAVCLGKNSAAKELIESRERSNLRNWVYVGQIIEIYELLIGDIKAQDKYQSKGVDKDKLAILNRYFLWLSALAEDGNTLHDSDPIAVALGQAAGRFGENVKVLTEDASRLRRGAPFIDMKTAWRNSSLESVIPFIDLRAQQDRIRPSLESLMQKVLNHGRYVNGPEIDELESVLSKFVGVKHCVCVSSGTDALLIALMSLGIGCGDEVVTTTFSFIATCEAILLTGAVPIFVDVDHRTGNIDPEQLEARITNRTRAILPVSLYGQTANIRRINEIATVYRLPVIEDAAQSFGSSHYGVRSCGLTTIGCTSFFPAKTLGAYGDSGACFTNDSKIAETMRELINHGQRKRYEHVRVGINGRMDSLQAAVLLAKFGIFEWELKNRQIVADRYTNMMDSLERKNKLKLPYIERGNYSAWSQYTIQVGDRESLRQALIKAGIPSAIHYPQALPDQPVLQLPTSEFPISKELAQTVLSLPMHPYIKLNDQRRIVDTISRALN